MAALLRPAGDGGDARDGEAAADRVTPVPARRLRGLLAGGRCDGGRGRGGRRTGGPDDGRRFRRLPLALVPADQRRSARRCPPRTPTAAGHRPASWPRLRRPARSGWGVRHGPRTQDGSLREDAAAIAGDLADLRHPIHREPEIGLDLPQTQQEGSARWTGCRWKSPGPGAQLRDRGAARRPARPAGGCCSAATWTRCRSPSGPAWPTPPRCAA